MKCPTCRGCFEIVWIKDTKLYWCWLCQKYYKYTEESNLLEEFDITTL